MSEMATRARALKARVGVKLLALPSIRMLLRLRTESNSKKVTGELEIDSVQLAFDAYVGSGPNRAGIAYRPSLALRVNRADVSVRRPLIAARLALGLLIFK